MKRIIEILKEHGGLSTSELAIKLCQKSPMSNDNARKIISRCLNKKNSPISVLEDFNLASNAKFIFIKKQAKNLKFFYNLRKACMDLNSPFAYILNAFYTRGGVITESKFKILSGSQNESNKHIDYNSMLSTLIKNNICQRVEFIDGTNLILQVEKLIDYKKVFAMKQIEEIITNCLKKWLKDTGFGSYKTIEKQAEFGGFEWDISSPSFINAFRKIKPHGFVVADVIYHNLNDKSLNYFIHKIDILNNKKGYWPFLPILIAKSFTKDAYNLGKRKGIIVTTPKILFGEEVELMLSTLFDSLLKNSLSNEEFNAFVETLKDLQKINGSSLNLKGSLFEFITAQIVQGLYGEPATIGKIISKPYDSKSKEIDVFAKVDDLKLAFYECKGINKTKNIDKDTVEKWFESIIYTIDWLESSSDDYSPYEKSFELWTTGGVEDEAVKFVETEKKAYPNISIDIKNGTNIKQLIKNNHFKNKKAIVDALNQFYFDLPV